MHKAIRLKVNLTLRIEAEAEPAADFAAETTAVVRGLLAAGGERYPAYQVTIEKIEEDTSDEDDEAPAPPPRRLPGPPDERAAGADQAPTPKPRQPGVRAE